MGVEIPSGMINTVIDAYCILNLAELEMLVYKHLLIAHNHVFWRRGVGDDIFSLDYLFLTDVLALCTIFISINCKKLTAALRT